MSKILEIAKECGFHMDFLRDKQALLIVENFAQAVIENYKAGLVPVAYVDKNSAGQKGNRQMMIEIGGNLTMLIWSGMVFAFLIALVWRVTK